MLIHSRYTAYLPIIPADREPWDDRVEAKERTGPIRDPQKIFNSVSWAGSTSEQRHEEDALSKVPHSYCISGVCYGFGCSMVIRMIMNAWFFD